MDGGRFTVKKEHDMLGQHVRYLKWALSVSCNFGPRNRIVLCYFDSNTGSTSVFRSQDYA